MRQTILPEPKLQALRSPTSTVGSGLFSDIKRKKEDLKMLANGKSEELKRK
ncbi:hypothetical protein COLO4_19828 [Corchorus olitorius]|uniref:Uncharacterized protein n=1 Tax=Corchorus olitorius TaxID=93759 RepID=A0A1R3J3B9_9ROSI|nr:hypothetical protein COLO4_19828 [Corchorus olitorius]